MRIPALIVTAVVVTSAHGEPIADRDQAAAAQRQAEQQKRLEWAAARCNANRGTDCETIEGLQEWILLDRSRADAVLDRISPGSASTGASVPQTVSPATPQTTPRNVP